MRRLALAPTLVCAFLSPPAAFALGVGEIELQSALNQPLDAEIPLRGVPADQSDEIIVALASEEAFREIGLSRPFSLTRLEFDVVTREGTPYIQISSREPISEPFLNFLIEVDAPDGNLLREYTVLLDPPVFASDEADSSDDDARQADNAADAHGATESDEADMSGEVGSAPAEHEAPEQQMTTATPGEVPSESGASSEGGMIPSAGPVEAEEADEPAPVAGTPEQQPDSSPDSEITAEREGEFGDTPLFLEVAREEEEAERREREARLAEREAEAEEAQAEAEAASAAPATETPSVPEQYGEVAEGETLWDIAEQLRRGDTTVQQMMVALLRYNPEAFEDGNVNRLKQGYVLRVPDSEDASSISAQQAIASVREQNGLWREWRESIGQAQATQVAGAEQAQDTDEMPAPGGERGGEGVPGEPDNRLDIVGAEEGGATSDESASATASDANASEELKLAREELASVRSEREELADRVAQLEDTVDKMEQLVTVREDQLSRLQEQLRELETESGSAEPAQEQDDEIAVAANAGAGASPEAGAQGGGDPSGEGQTENVADADEASASAPSDGAQTDGSGESAAGESAEAETRASDEPPQVTPTESPERGWLDTVFGVVAGVGAALSGAAASVMSGGLFSPVLLGGLALLLGALGLVAVRRRRAKQAVEEEELAAGIAAAQSSDVEVEGEVAPDAESAVASEPMDESADTGDDAPDSLFDGDLDLSDLGPEPVGETGGEKDETIDEADVYLAYGLHQQAEDLLRLASQENPQRSDYHEKLLETLFAAGKSDEFVAAANQFRQQVGNPPAQAWERVVAMGQQIAPQHALFTGAAGAASATAAAPAAQAPGGADDLDFDLDLENGPDAESGGNFGASAPNEDLTELGIDAPAPSAADTGSSDDDLAFDLSDFEEAPPAAESANTPAATSSGDDGLDFDIGDLGDGFNGTAESGGTESAPGATESSESAGLEFDIGDLGDGVKGTAESGATESAPAAMESSESEGLEFDIGDLGDLGDLNATDESGQSATDAGGDAPSTSTTPSTDEGPDLGFALDDALDLDDSTDGSGGADDEFDLSEFDGAFGSVESGGAATAAETSVSETADAPHAAPAQPLEDDLGGGLEDDLGLSAADDGADVVDFDLGGFEEGVGDQVGANDASANNADAAVGDEEDLATMLDLAKAYIDMGDAESASNALEEVIAGGSEEQRAEARGLLETVQ